MLILAAIRSQICRNTSSILRALGPRCALVKTVSEQCEVEALSQVPIEPAVHDQATPQKRLGWGTVAAIFIVCLLVIGLGIGIWQLRPKEPPIGRPIGAAGNVQAFAIPASPVGEGFTIWRDGRQIYALPSTSAAGYQRVELSSNDVDIAGSGAPDLVLYAWTGGAHCCFTQILIDGQSGRLLGKLDLGNGDPMPFLPAQKSGLRRAVAINFDDVTAYKFGSYADSPMARIVAAWDGKRFSLDVKRMKAARADSPPDYFISEPELGDALPLGILDLGENEDVPAPGLTSKIDGAPRGDRAKTYQAWMDSEESRMRATSLIARDATSYGPMAAFLNERIYKGQAVAGVATIMNTYEATPTERDAALIYYFDILKQSRWLSDLDRLNGGQLTAIMAKLDATQPPHAPSKP